ncbi:polyprenol monophosphomannose synthase [uncultured Thiodictyon sp.]|uniref:polyprenol monophosphomannose synthase n=1 Tax=uncultured Thiodictyon sp. TaxID=1846217 RepID=UPI0025D157A0|nr:polyprenol monophosphomannose synthase [uncultured Thiodictyon sp.]
MPSTIVIVPTYNEADNLPVLAQRLLALDPPLAVLIVDDASPDGTGARADAIAAREPRLRVLHRTGPRGYAAACREGLRLALDGGYARICTMDADLSHDPAALPELIQAVAAGADLAIGSRYVEGGEILVDWGPVRRAVSRSGSAYARAMTGAPVHDCTSGFRCYRAAALAQVPLARMHSDGYSFLIEVLAAFARAEARIIEVPIRYVDRRAGASKISRRIIVEAFGITSWLGLRRLLKR